MAQTVDFQIIRFALSTAVPAVIMVFSVAIILTIGLVVLAVIRHKIHQSEAVVSRNEIHAGLNSPTL